MAGAGAGAEKVKVEKTLYVGNQHGKWIKQWVRVLSGPRKGQLLITRTRIPRIPIRLDR